MAHTHSPQAGTATEPPATELPVTVLPAFDAARLSAIFASELPELAVPWRAAVPEKPELVALNEPLARELGLDPQTLRDELGVRFLIGTALAPGSTPVAQLYSGHQFGMYNPRLGDGRALLLGEITGDDGQPRDLHLKGSGRSPFARGDGFAPLGPMLREYLVSEFMHRVGIPTTRSLAVVSTGRVVSRDELLPGAVLARVASSHLRVGSFQYAFATGDVELLRRLADHAIARHYTDLSAADSPYLRLLEAVIDAQARLVASWMGIGFVHGVMNTDNVTISGETIDYGPCAFLDAYDPTAVFSSIDVHGRYAFANQPQIALWNLTRFAETLLPLIDADEETAKRLAIDALGGFQQRYDDALIAVMRAKLGLGANATADSAAEAAPAAAPHADDEAVAALAGTALGLLRDHRIDYTRFFRALTDSAGAGADDIALRSLFTDAQASRDLSSWLDSWRAYRPNAAAMTRANPVYIPRNHLLDEAFDAAHDGNLAPFERLRNVLDAPFDERPGFERYALPAPPGSRPTITTCGT